MSGYDGPCCQASSNDYHESDTSSPPMICNYADVLIQPETSQLYGNQYPLLFYPPSELEGMWDFPMRGTPPSLFSHPTSPYSELRDSPWYATKPRSPESERPFSEREWRPMVPQKRYKPHTASDRRRYVDEINLEPPIKFLTKVPDEEGIPLRDAMHFRFARLVAHDEPIFEERGSSILVCINWPGYQPWSRQIPTRDFRNPPGPITRAKLVKQVAKSIARFIAEHKDRLMEDSGPTSAVGPGKIDVFDLVLVRLDHISKGNWQAQLQLIHPHS